MIKEYSNCRLCKSSDIQVVLNFGETALANSYLSKNNLDNIEFKAPLEVFKCNNCGSFQLKHTVDKDLLFKNYLYSSSTSPSLVKHFENYAKDVYKKCNLSSKSFVIDVGSNDGILLEPFKKLGVQVLGIEPAQNLAEIAHKKDCPTLVAYFTKETIQNIEKYSEKFSFNKKADVITSNNCFAHIDDLKEILESVNICLKDDGYFIFENAYWLETIKGKYFDQIYHEHIFYHSIKPLVNFLNTNGFSIVDIEKNTNQGGTIRVFCQKRKYIENNKIIFEFIKEEEKFGLYENEIYKVFINNLDNLKKEILHLIKLEKENGKKIACYGAPAKATLFCKFFNLNKNLIDFIVDDSPFKQGLYLPDLHLPILDKSFLLKNNIDCIIITAWNFSDSIIKNNLQYKNKWIIPMPTIQIY